MDYKLIFYNDSELLEGPVYDSTYNFLYFVSILDGTVYFLDLTTKEIISVKLDSPVGCVFIVGKKKVMAASKNGFYEINFNTRKSHYAFQMEISNFVRYNDGAMDPNGRYIVGTMGYPKVQDHIGKVFSYFNGTYKAIIEKTTISNGLVFSKNGKILYFIDTPTKKVAKYNYDTVKGSATFDSFIIEFNGIGSPDGMCMDQDGMLWIAEWGGGQVSNWNPKNGKMIGQIKLPCLNVSSCCLDDLGNLFVTTAKSDNPDDVFGGGLFYVNLNKKI
ncbi:SMP-30/gluconolactonase/LRE family protein [Allomuricauda sp. F6463D]|uniref:SMP-30/gluconolactonase/LRE family protein n=1 Tax=Allomuricauda sp. F6463D TaxID=2926409 RepID=UPI001FF0E5CB|nr:SMP-30/gluconolactonase/LRE family protein [Muricauda sp. F6463D]MCK0159309.1 SMP-30/gluconolactonase/LRE family protein [Muricauda sp. F6463D]